MSSFSPRLRLLQGINAVCDRLPVDDEALSPFLNVLRRLRKLTAGRDVSAVGMRRRFAADMRSLHVGLPVGSVESVTITGARTVAARLYRPTKQALPVLIVYFHGGGFVMGDLDTHDDGCRLLCEQSGMPVLSVEYRLAPENPFPAGLEDADVAVRWALAQRQQLGVDAIALAGDSAGASISAVTAQAFAKEGVELRAQLLMYPGTDLSTRRPSHRAFGVGYFLDQRERDVFYESYLAGRPELATNPRVSPLLEPKPARLPPALVATAGYDILRDEGEAYADYLAQHGFRVERIRFARLVHGFLQLATVHTESRKAVVQLAQQLQQLCR